MRIRTPLQRHRDENGNILFLILLAVVLFAALSYAVTQSMRGGGKDASDEQNKLAVNRILQYFADIDQAMVRLTLTGNIPKDMVSYNYDWKRLNDTGARAFPNNACSTTACELFDPAGGGIAAQNFEEYAVAAPTGWDPLWGHPGYFEPWIYIWPYAGTSLPDVVFTFMAIKPAICNALAAQLGQSYRPSISGSTLHGSYNSVDWDTATAVFSGTTEQQNFFATHDTVVLAEEGSGDGAFCHILHLVLRR